MKIGITEYSKMNTYYLMQLYRERTKNANQQILIEISKRLKMMPIQELLNKWLKEKNITLKELLEVTISERIVRYEPVIEYENYPEILKKFIEEVTSIDALCILMNLHNEIIKSNAKDKYNQFIKEYLELMDNEQLYQTEGNDCYLTIKHIDNIIEFPIEKISKTTETTETAKIYKFRKRKKENENDKH